MKTRADWLEELRPLTQEALDREEQEFETMCLYPLVQFQESYIIQFLAKSAANADPLYGIIKPLEKIRVIKKVMENKAAVRNQVLGMVLGLMRNEEMAFFDRQPEKFSKSVLRHLLERMRGNHYLLG
jgi:hypothetical protein